MELSLADYRLTRLLRESGHSRTFEAVAQRDGRELIAKVFELEEESVEARVEHEFELIRGLEIEGVVRAEALRRVGDQLVLILERAPGIDLQRLGEGKPQLLERFFSIAVQVAEILAATHAKRVIHRDIKPANLLFDPESGRVHIADFGISVLLESERRRIYDDRVLVGTLPYISPEQTGRTNRGVDFRSDLYSLGVTFYELLTGERPFEGLAPLELIHAHLARTPRAPDHLHPELPAALSRLVMKLMAKAPERRYQSAAGLAGDLRALAKSHAAGTFEPGFVLGRADRANQLQLPHQLYGREQEAQELRAEFEAVVGSRGRRTTILAGPTGIGKSALLGVLEVSVVAHGGYLLRGRFEGEQPYSAFVSALTGLFEQLLTESEARLGRWRRHLLEELGALANIACDLLPTLELLLGPQPSVVELGPIEARNRLRVAIERLLACLCTEAPLVLILDDLHDADRDSLGLFEALCQASEGPLLIAVSVNELDFPKGHALEGLLGEGSEALPRTRVVELGPLDAGSVEALLRDALSLGDGDRTSLVSLPDFEAFAQIMLRKSGGVPLFLLQLLRQLVGAGLLHSEGARWSWERAAVEAAALPDDAVEMMRARLGELGAEQRELLGRAACLGASFGLGQLAHISGCSAAELAARSFALLDAGLLASVGNEYRFSHASIREAALSELEPEAQRAVHWAIGRRLLDEFGVNEHPEALYVIVEHLERGMPETLEPESHRELALLDLRGAAWPRYRELRARPASLRAGAGASACAR